MICDPLQGRDQFFVKCPGGVAPGYYMRPLRGHNENPSAYAYGTSLITIIVGHAPN
jgi:hypothetical protein